MKKIKIFLSLILLIEVTLSYAQITTSSISGQVTDSNGLPVESAVIVAVHAPTNSQYSTFTDHEGNYRILNMRSGGPYLVVVRLLGYRDVKVNNVNLALSGDLVLDIRMEMELIDVLDVAVFSNSKNSNMLTSDAGAITNVSARDISLMPTINRSINDVMRFTPQANGQAIGGGNYRQNFVTVDGAAFNNAFGIGPNLPGDGSPISIEALEQVSVSLTPYDVRQSGFIGANINAVTKSGTNEFRGSFYTYMTDNRLQGNRVGDTYINNPSSKTNMYGVTFGGPIVKNKLFFFANYEAENTIAPGPARVASTNGVAEGTTIARPTVSDMDMMSKYLRDTYGYETGPYQNYSFESPGKKFLARIDWNITPYHKFNLRYSHMDSKTPFDPSLSSPYIPSGGGRSLVIRNMNSMWYQNSGYFQHFNFNSLSGELNSRFMEGKLNNLLRVTYSNQDEPRSANGKTFPFVDIIKDNAVYASFGTELFSYNNLRQVKTWNITDELKYDLGINSLTLGLSYETNHIKNGFMRQGAGYYAFNSWDDFVNGADPVFYSITFSNAPGYKPVFPGFKFDQYSLYLQNEVKIGDRLNLTGGLRFDLPTYPAFPEALQTHPMI
ncbi:MAG: TonB-dependent receptor, partial [Candidatus Azobacteroides sp.]|nr:TonB-dependent receptor [Candidatus Azobacteroides sp.]